MPCYTVPLIVVTVVYEGVLVRFFVLFLGLLLSAPAWAGDGLVVEGWARATASKARTGAAYLTIRNNSAAAEKLLSSSSGVAKRAALHNHTMAGGVMKMRPVETVEIPAKGMVMMKPGGLHIMLMGLNTQLVKGADLPLSLTFEKAGTIEVQVKILGMGAKSMHGHQKHKN